MPVRTDGIICRECGGAGCSNCNNSGYSYMRAREPSSGICFADVPIVPMPYGKLLPAAYSYTEVDGFECPGCGSTNVARLDGSHEADWFCISCQDSWCYEREH